MNDHLKAWGEEIRPNGTDAPERPIPADKWVEMEIDFRQKIITRPTICREQTNFIRDCFFNEFCGGGTITRGGRRRLIAHRDRTACPMSRQPDRAAEPAKGITGKSLTYRWQFLRLAAGVIACTPE